jgi:tRNA (cmo5U34)-methyltransferase
MAKKTAKTPARTVESTDGSHSKLVPGSEDFYRTVLDLLPFEASSKSEILDLAAGTGFLSAMIAEAFPKARLTLFDPAPELLLVARQRMKPFGSRIRFASAQLPSATPSKSYDAVVSSLAIYHLPDGGKRHLFGDIFKYLSPGGVFINADQVAGETAAIDERSRELWIRRVRELKIAERDLVSALSRMKQDLPSTVGQHLTWMREAGFVEVSCVYRNLIFAVISGTKPGGR